MANDSTVDTTLKKKSEEMLKLFASADLNISSAIQSAQNIIDLFNERITINQDLLKLQEEAQPKSSKVAVFNAKIRRIQQMKEAMQAILAQFQEASSKIKRIEEIAPQCLEVWTEPPTTPGGSSKREYLGEEP